MLLPSHFSVFAFFDLNPYSTTIISYMDKDELEQLRISDWLAVAYSRNSAKVKMLWEKISDDPEV